MDNLTKESFKNILIVDDSSTARMIVKRCFDIAGFQDCKYYFAENGVEAMQILENDTVDLVVTDVNMPEMDGNKLIKKLKKDDKTKKITIIVISTMDNIVIEDELAHLGIKWVVKKPLVPAKIIKLFENMKNNNFDKDKIIKTMIGSTIRTFEQMAFLEVIEEKNKEKGQDFDFKVGIKTLEPLPSKILMMMSKELIEKITENIYSDTVENLTIDVIADCLKELLNVLTGNFLRDYYGERKKYDMKIPEIMIEDLKKSKNDDELDFDFNAEGIFFRIKFIYEKGLFE